MAPKFARKRPASALCTVPVPCSTVSTAPAPDSTASEEAKKRQEKIVPWNKGTKMAKSDMQHLFIPKQDYNLFLAVAIYFAGPKYAMAMWLTMATSRRISEALRLHGCDAYLEGGPHHDSPHILFQKREKEKQFPGAGKLGGQNVVARLSADACATLKSVMENNVERKLLPALAPFQESHPQVFEDFYPMNADTFKWPTDGSHVFPAASKKSKKPWMARQSVSLALARTLEVMFRLTNKRRWNQTFKGSHVTVHGATRHTSAALLLATPQEGCAVPSEHVIMEIQQRHDIKTFRRHYCHAQDDEISQALEHASIPVAFQDEAPAIETNEQAEAAAAAPPVPAASASSHAPIAKAKSRNAWRQKKRSEAKKAWKASVAPEHQQD